MFPKLPCSFLTYPFVPRRLFSTNISQPNQPRNRGIRLHPRHRIYLSSWESFTMDSMSIVKKRKHRRLEVVNGRGDAHRKHENPQQRGEVLALHPSEGRRLFPQAPHGFLDVPRALLGSRPVLGLVFKGNPQENNPLFSRGGDFKAAVLVNTQLPFIRGLVASHLPSRTQGSNSPTTNPNHEQRVT